MRKLLIIGAGGHGRSLAEAVLGSEEFLIACFLDDAFPQLKCVWNIPVLGKVDDFARWRGIADCAVVAIGNNAVRLGVARQLQGNGFELATVIHPSAIVSPTAMIGTGGAIMAGSIVGTEARLGEGVIVNCGAVVDHHCQIGNYGHLGVNAAMAGGAILGALAWMQAGSVLGYGVEIAEGRVLMPGEAVS